MNIVALHQIEIAARLSAESYFSDITVLTEREGDISGKIDGVLKGLVSKGGKIGATVLVGVFRGNVNNPDTPGPHYDEAFNDVTAFERVTLNQGASGTQKACVDIIDRAAEVLHLYRPAPLGQTIFAAKDAIRPLGEVQPGVIAYKLVLQISPNVDRTAKVATPAISPASGAAPQTVTITCGTSGAAIYYTIDGSYPAAGNSQATLYTVALSISLAATLRAVAHKTGMIASDAAAAQYT